LTILMVEDDEHIIEFVKRGLEAEGHLVDVARNGREALQLAPSPVYNLLLLDLMLPDLTGQEVCRQLRAEGVKTPILMLTATDSIDDKVEGLRLGADDYLTKPFAFDELVARIQALLRRNQGYKKAVVELVANDLVLNCESRTVRRGEHLIELTAKEFTLLEYLMTTPGKVFSKSRILSNVWGYSSDPLTNVVEVYIRNLRRKIDIENTPSLIKTSRGFGYKIDVEK